MGFVVAKLVPVGIDQEASRGCEPTALAHHLDAMLTGQSRDGNGDSEGEASRAICRGGSQGRAGIKGGDVAMTVSLLPKAVPLIVTVVVGGPVTVERVMVAVAAVA